MDVQILSVKVHRAQLIYHQQNSTSQGTVNVNDYLPALSLSLSTLLFGTISAAYPFCGATQTTFSPRVNMLSKFQPVAWLPLVMVQHHSHFL